MLQSSFPTVALLGFTGSEQTTGALYTAHVTGRKTIPSIYNSPGSYASAAAFNALSKTPIWDGLHAQPGVSVDPAALAPSEDTAPGPKYTAVASGTLISSTGPISKLIVEHSRRLPITTISGRRTTPLSVTIVELPDAPASEDHPIAKVSAPVIIPVFASAAAAAASGIQGDWIAMSMIVLGMVCGGVSSFALQSGDLTFTRPVSTPGVPAGDGYLEVGNEIIVLKGTEAAVTSVTRGRFSLRYKSEGRYNMISACGSLLTAQCIIQLLVVPFGTIFGQFCFFLSLTIAWIYNSYVSRQEKSAWKRLVLEDLLKAPVMERYSLGTRTSAAVFIMQELQPANVEDQLALLLPNSTPVWKAWRQVVARELQSGNPNFKAIPTPAAFNADEDRLLRTLFADAQAAVDAFTQSKI